MINIYNKLLTLQSTRNIHVANHTPNNYITHSEKRQNNSVVSYTFLEQIKIYSIILFSDGNPSISENIVAISHHERITPKKLTIN